MAKRPDSLKSKMPGLQNLPDGTTIKPAEEVVASKKRLTFWEAMHLVFDKYKKYPAVKPAIPGLKETPADTSLVQLVYEPQHSIRLPDITSPQEV